MASCHIICPPIFTRLSRMWYRYSISIGRNQATLSLHTLSMWCEHSWRGYLLYLATTCSAERHRRTHHLHFRYLYAQRSQCAVCWRSSGIRMGLGEIEAKFHQPLLILVRCAECYLLQSIGEPAMQITLNTFHYVGVYSKNVTLGVPHLKEIISALTNSKTPSLLVYLEPDIAEDRMMAKNTQAINNCRLSSTSCYNSMMIKRWYKRNLCRSTCSKRMTVKNEY